MMETKTLTRFERIVERYKSIGLKDYNAVLDFLDARDDILLRRNIKINESYAVSDFLKFLRKRKEREFRKLYDEIYGELGA